MINYNIHNIVKVQSNIELPLIVPTAFRVNTVIPDLRIHVGDFELKNENDQSIYSEYRLGPMKRKTLLKNIEGNTQLAQKTFFVEGFASANPLIRSVLQAKLLLKKYWRLHAGSVSKNDEGVVLVASSGIGKTFTTLSLIKNYKFRFLSDDMTLTDGTYAYCYPKLLLLEPSDIRAFGVKLSLRDRLKRMTSRLKNRDTGIRLDLTEAERYIGTKFNVKKSVKVNMVYILRKGKPNVVKADKEEAFKKIITTTRSELFPYGNRLLWSYAQKNPSFKIEQLLKNEEQICRTLVEKSECFIVSHDNRGHNKIIACHAV